MPVFLPAFPEERRHGRRRGNLKGRSTDRARAHFLRRTTLGLFKWHLGGAAAMLADRYTCSPQAGPHRTAYRGAVATAFQRPERPDGTECKCRSR